MSVYHTLYVPLHVVFGLTSAFPGKALDKCPGSGAARRSAPGWPTRETGPASPTGEPMTPLLTVLRADVPLREHTVNAAWAYGEHAGDNGQRAGEQPVNTTGTFREHGVACRMPRERGVNTP